MVQRELWPRFQAGEAPPFHLDLEDEVGGRVIPWDVYQGGELVGWAETKISPRPDRTFELRNDVLFAGKKNTALFTGLAMGPLVLRKITDTYWVTAKGALKSFSATMLVDLSGAEARIEIRGEVDDGVLLPKLLVNGLPWPMEPVDLSRQGNVLNILHPQHKIPGLYEGRSWTIPVFNPLSTSSLLGKDMKMPRLIAMVASDELPGSGRVVPCWRIDVSEPGKEKPVSRIWVRKRDDLVLQLEAEYQSNNLVLKRSGVK
jgi:hypothetical protein